MFCQHEGKTFYLFLIFSPSSLCLSTSHPPFTYSIFVSFCVFLVVPIHIKYSFIYEVPTEELNILGTYFLFVSKTQAHHVYLFYYSKSSNFIAHYYYYYLKKKSHAYNFYPIKKDMLFINHKAITINCIYHLSISCFMAIAREV